MFINMDVGINVNFSLRDKRRDRTAQINVHALLQEAKNMQTKRVYVLAHSFEVEGQAHRRANQKTRLAVIQSRYLGR